MISSFFGKISNFLQLSNKKIFQHPTVIAGFIIISYIIICYLELSFAALVEFTMQGVWPTFHAVFLLVEAITLRCSSVVRSSDDVLQV